ncbi:alpha/beta hydrolase [Kribbella shirazensis]|uniref:Pimeloyl-ACP methyl ester carboxylesterase n=1 Tax=Kribbella shirazensis TaxID=1105143 RepID=A0A7X6A4E3_9ACTN|nr:alpha/beta hydrolase [Kribbella shirazensis]NIK61412.1 pimeloyl-ACP methyl ester carboxylesterase [Kribbella shirazensis]
MTTYGLIHGAHHGSWCWDFLVPELEARGHRALAVDLPADDPSAGVSRYAEIALTAFEGADDDFVVVGHSLGGLTAPIVAARRSARHLVFLTAPVPQPGQSFNDQARTEPPRAASGSDKIDNGDGTMSRTDDESIRLYYHDCSEERRRYALARLRRQSVAPHAEVSPLSSLPDVSTTYIMCTDDRSLRPEYQRFMARERLGLEPVELVSSHSPFLSRPAELADVLAGLS